MDLVPQQEIESRIFAFGNVQAMLDRDLALLFKTETRTLKQAVNRNINRFPSDFMFELTDDMISLLVSQSVIPSKSFLGGARPYAFTEQGVAMLTSVIHTDIAVLASLKIIRAFVQMRKVFKDHAFIFQKLDKFELKQIEADQKFEQIFKALESKDKQPEIGIFFEGQIFDAYTFVASIVKKADKSIILIDNFIDETVLLLLSKRKSLVTATIFTKQINKQLELDIKKHNQQYPAILVLPFANSHDRFLIIDDKELYHIGASLKDLGKKWFAFSKMDSLTNEVLSKLI